MFVNCSILCDVQHVRSSVLGQNVIFGKFDVWTFNVRSVRNSVFWCSFQDYSMLFHQIGHIYLCKLIDANVFYSENELFLKGKKECVSTQE